jgi:hypothetical protein
MTRRLKPLPGAVLCLVCVAVPTVAAIIFCLYRANVMHEAWPYDSFLPPLPLFGDFLGVQTEWAQYHFGAGPGLVYLPAIYLPIDAFVRTVPNFQTEGWLSASFFLAAASVVIALTLRRQGLVVGAIGVVIFLIAYPTWFDLITGNLEGWIFVLVITAFLLNSRSRWVGAAVVLGLAIAVKGEPIVFLPCLFVGRSLRDAARSTAVAAGSAIFATVASIGILGGDSIHEIYERLQAGQAVYRDLMIDTVAGTHYGNSFLNGVHAFFGQDVLPSRRFEDIVGVVVLVSIGTVFLIGLRRHAPMWLMLGLSACAGCLAAPTSTDYKLLYFIPAIVFLLAEESVDRSWLPGAVILCLIITPKPWGQRLADPFSVASVYVTPVLMIMFVGWALRYVLVALKVEHAAIPAAEAPANPLFRVLDASAKDAL